jgi:membrane protein YdbS with pleckstrin-like domain
MEENRSPDLERRVRTCRIIVLALCCGVVLFAVIAVAMRLGGLLEPPPALPILSYVAAAFALAAVIASFIVPGVIEKSWREQWSRERQAAEGACTPDHEEAFLHSALTLFQTRLIVRCAIVEGAALFQLVAYFLEGQPFSLGLAFGLLFALAFTAPSREGAAGWLARAREPVESGPMS